MRLSPPLHVLNLVPSRGHVHIHYDLCRDLFRRSDVCHEHRPRRVASLLVAFDPTFANFQDVELAGSPLISHGPSTISFRQTLEVVVDRGCSGLVRVRKAVDRAAESPGSSACLAVGQLDFEQPLSPPRLARPSPSSRHETRGCSGHPHHLAGGTSKVTVALNGKNRSRAQNRREAWLYALGSVQDCVFLGVLALIREGHHTSNVSQGQRTSTTMSTFQPEPQRSVLVKRLSCISSHSMVRLGGWCAAQTSSDQFIRAAACERWAAKIVWSG
ncbi:hypothetical protein C8Q76DRAFT_168616 [Earliella scabrosa]|nr:hypothetical protein C8Q76DRAFT_168616 [Earliella scabrosa]